MADRGLELDRRIHGHGVGVPQELTDSDVEGPDGSPGWDRLEVPYVSEADFAGELLGYADAVIVESPVELKASVRHRLSGVLTGARGPR
ncbi:MAG: WYL domain-containing protein [Marmoricola sp.]